MLSFLLRHGRIFTGHRPWSRAHLRWLAGQAFNHPAQQIVFQDQVDAVADAQARLERLDRQLTDVVPTWSMAPVVAACQAMRGVSFLVAVTFVAEIGDVRRFESPRQLMAFLGLVPSERSTGDTVRRGGLTLAGHRRVRRALVEGARSYRHPARVTETIRVRLEGLPKAVREIAWKAQVRSSADDPAYAPRFKAGAPWGVLMQEGTPMIFIFQFVRFRRGVPEVIGQRRCEAPDGTAALARAKTLVGTSDWPSTAEAVRVLDGGGRRTADWRIGERSASSP